jgi:hypothetical protein
MACGIAQAIYGGVPEPIRQGAYELLDDRLGDLTRNFSEAFGCP